MQLHRRIFTSFKLKGRTLELAICADSSWNRWHPSYEALGDRCKRNGIAALELAYYPENKDFESASEILSSYGVRVVSVNATSKLRINVLEDPRAAQDQLIQCINLADSFGAKYVVMYPGTRPHWNFVDQINNFKRRMDPVFSVAVEKGITLLLENHFDLRGEDPLHRDVVREPDRTAVFFSAIDCPNLKLNFDAGNVYIAGIEPWPYAYRILKEFIVYAHFKDATRYSEELHGSIESNELLSDKSAGIFLPVAVGEGGINYAGLLREMSLNANIQFGAFEDHTSADRAEGYYDRGISYLRSVMTIGSNQSELEPRH